jgi:predicted amidophosphoribosyltransferase
MKFERFLDSFLGLLFPRESFFEDTEILKSLKASPVEVSKDYLCLLNCEQVLVLEKYEILKKWIHLFKYHHEKYLYLDFAEFVFLKLKPLDLDFDLILYCPSDPKRYKNRGYSPVKLIAMEMSNKFKVPILGIFRKKFSTRAQTLLDREARLGNLKNCFELDLSLETRNQLKEINKVLLFDDLITTGTTLSELVTILKYNYPALKIYVVVLARN